MDRKPSFQGSPGHIKSPADSDVRHLTGTNECANKIDGHARCANRSQISGRVLDAEQTLGLILVHCCEKP